MNEVALHNLTESEQELLRESYQRLFTSGAILREEHRDLYEWCRVHRDRLSTLAALGGFKIDVQEEQRIILALPHSSKLLRRFKQDETLLALALWYDFDRAVKDDGKTPDDVRFSVRVFNENLATKFKDLKLPTPTRMREILQLFESKSLIRLSDTASADLADTVIRVLPTLRFLIPFPGIEEWHRQCDRHVQAAKHEKEDVNEPQD